MFKTALSIKLDLTVNQTTSNIVAGNIKNLSIDYRSDGFEASLDFWVICLKDQSEDSLFSDFISQDPMKAKLTIDRTYDSVGETAGSIVLTGLVVKKHVAERAFPDLAGEPVLHRHYRIEFMDRGQALWRQHFPTALYVDKSKKQLLDDHKPDGVTVTYSFTGADTTHPVLSLGLGAPENQASYYDFLLWFCAKENASLVYDASDGSYEVAAQKKNLTTEVEFYREDVAEIEAFFPEIDRSTVTVLNGSTQASTTSKAVTNSQSVTGVKRNYLIVSQVSADLDARATLETGRHKLREPEAHVTFCAYPSVTMLPNQVMSFAEGFSTNIFQNGKKYRLERIRIEAHATQQEATDDDEEEINRYDVEYRAELELKTDVAKRVRPHVTPSWPFYVEGKVLSEQGADGEATHQMYTDSATSVQSYKVKIPLFADQKVVVPWNPSLLSGHFYFPAYREERVLVALDFDKAWITRYLDWRVGAQLPQDTQGNSIQFGKKVADGTSVAHTYKEQKPVFEIHRVKDKDDQSITISDGTILISTKENP